MIQPTYTSRKKQFSNRTEDNQMRRMAAAGDKPQAISNAMQIDLKVVKSVLVHYKANKERYDEILNGPQVVSRIVVEETDPAPTVEEVFGLPSTEPLSEED